MPGNFEIESGPYQVNNPQEKEALIKATIVQTARTITSIRSKIANADHSQLEGRNGQICSCSAKDGGCYQSENKIIMPLVSAV